MQESELSRRREAGSSSARVRVLVTLGAPYREPWSVGRPKDEYVEVIRRKLPSDWSLLIPHDMSEEELSRNAVDADAILGGNVSRRLMGAAPRLRVIHALGSGVDGVDLKAAVERRITVCNSKGLNAVAVAEHIFALMLCLAKNLRFHDAQVRDGHWDPVPSIILRDCTVGIVGFGAIGREVSRRALAFGMKVIATKKNPSSEIARELGLDFLGGEGDLDYVLANSDVVVPCLRLTDKTRGIIGRREFGVMKKGALFVNAARGALVDEKALEEALQSGALAGAGLDVFATEPIESTSGLLRLANVVLTPHVGGGVPRAGSGEWSSRIAFCLENIRKVLAGQMPENLATPFFGGV